MNSAKTWKPDVCMLRGNTSTDGDVCELHVFGVSEMNSLVRCLEAAEKKAKAAETELIRRQTELDKHQQDQKQTHELQQEINRDAAAKLEGLCCSSP